MKVLHVTNEYLNNGTGITNLLRTLALEQRSAGLDVAVAARTVRSEYIDELRAVGIEYVSIGDLRDPMSIYRAGRALRARQDVDLIHVHTVRATLAVLFAGRRVRRRSVATVHNIFQWSSVLMSYCAAVVCISVDVRRRMNRVAPWSQRRLYVIHNAVDVRTPFHLIDLPPRTIVYVGGLHHRKGVDLLLGYFAVVAQRVPDASLLIIGNRDEPHIEELVGNLPVGRVHFAGFMSDPRPAMAAAAAVAIPSRDEPFGLVAIEARACGAAIIASDVGGLREALSGGAAGELIALGDVSGWAGALEKVLIDDAYRDELRERARNGIDAFEPAFMEKHYMDVYRQLHAASQ